VPETVHASERSVCRGKEVSAVREYGAEETGGDAMAQKGACPRTWGGEPFDEGEDSLG